MASESIEDSLPRHFSDSEFMSGGRREWRRGDTWIGIGEGNGRGFAREWSGLGWVWRSFVLT